MDNWGIHSNILCWIIYCGSSDALVSSHNHNNRARQKVDRLFLFMKLASCIDSQSCLKQEYDIVKEDLKNLPLSPEEASIAQHRIGAVVPE